MVVMDSPANGYRDIILPLAANYPIVAQAVSVVAALHLSDGASEFQRPAELAQMAIIRKLRHHAEMLPPGASLDVSTWATILILLVGETITGSNDFTHLLIMLKCIERCGMEGIASPAPIRQFFLQQTRM